MIVKPENTAQARVFCIFYFLVYSGGIVNPQGILYFVFFIFLYIRGGDSKPENTAQARVFCIFLGIFVPPPELGPEWVGDRLCVARRARDSKPQGCIFGASI